MKSICSTGLGGSLVASSLALLILSSDLQVVATEVLSPEEFSGFSVEHAL